ncbi:MAG: Ig-like domain-containing protein, partial [Oscillospiraceae bacterium]|nr:Ig-like domain-containing protein [Oscillospiraceae bacterium]
MKRMISLALVLCMVLSLLPATVLAAVGDSFAVDFQNDVNATADLFANDYNAAGWAFSGVCKDGDTAAAKNKNTVEYKAAYGANIKTVAPGDYYAVKFKAPESGNYKITYKHYQAASGGKPSGGVGDVYLLGEDVTLSAAISGGTNKLFTGIVYGAAANTAATAAQTPEYMLVKDEVYTIAFVSTGPIENYTNHRMYPTSLTFECVGEYVAPYLKSAEISFEDDTVEEGKYTKTSIKGFYSDGNPYPMATATVTYESSDTSVAYVDENNGEIYATGDGAAVITAKAVAEDGKSATAKKTITVTKRAEVSALPDAISASLPRGIIELGSWTPLKITDENGTALGGGIEYTYDIENENIISEEGGVFKGEKMGKTSVTVTAKLGNDEKTCTFDAVVVGENLFTRNGVRHGEFENSVYFNDKSNKGVSASETLWSVTRDNKRDTFDYEIKSGISPVTGKPTNIFRAILNDVPPSNPSSANKMVWLQQGTAVNTEGGHSGQAVLEKGKIYEFSGNIALENVKTPTTVSSIINFFADGGVSAYRKLSLDEVLYEKTETVQPWTTFFSTPVYVNWDYKKHLNANATVQSKMPLDGAGFDVLFSEMSFHEVTFHEVEVTLSGTTEGAKTYDTFETSLKNLSNTGREIKFGNETEKPKVVYSTSNPVVAKVNDLGVVTVVSDGECEIYADVTIGDTTVRGVLPVSVSGLEVMFESIGVTARDEALSVGDTTQIDVALYNTDMSEASDEGITWYYESSNPSVVSVDQDGNVTAKAPGTAQISVFAKTEKVTAKDSVTITVSDSSPLVSASVVGANVVEKGYSIRLSATALHDSGNAADMSACEVRYSLADGAPEGIISVTEDGTVTGLALGTSSVVAEVKRGNTVYSEPYIIEVIEVVPKDHFIDFTARNATAENTLTIYATIEQDGYYLDREKTSQTVIANCLAGKKDSYNLAYAMYSKITKIADSAKTNTVEADTAIVFPVTYSGWYEPVFTGLPMSDCGYAHIYLDGKYLGDYNFSAPDKESDGARISTRMNPIYVEGGENHTLTVRSFKKGADGGTRQYMVSFELDWLVNEPEISALSMSAEDNEIIIGETANVVVTGDMGIGKTYRFGLNHGYIADEENYVVLHSDNEDVIEIVDGVPKAVGEGSATISADVYYKGEKLSSPAPITITALAPAFTDVVLSAEKQTFAPFGEGCAITVKAYNSKGEELVIPEGGVTFESSDSATAEVSANGFITPLASSSETCKITATVTIDGLVRHGSLTVTVREGKIASTYYTEERVANARENIATYKWAKSTMNTAVKNADKYLPYVDEIYDMIHSQGILRSNFVGVREDPEFRYCRYCGEDLVVKYNRFPWSMDPLNRPWKIQCPECKRTFPSNDFESFYENGLNEHGEFDRTYALENNGILCGRGERDEETQEYIVFEQFKDNPYGYGDPNGNLFNEIYPELYNPNSESYGIDPRTKDPITHGWGDFELPHAGYIWGVDDSLGYETGRTCTKNGDREVHTYISLYSFLGLWTQRYEKNSAIIEKAIEAFRDAYVYTGDAKYARAGIVLLDRIADFYPTYNTMENLDHGFMAGVAGDKSLGNLVGNVWEGGLVRTYMEAYDAFFEVYDDPWVVEYLSKRAVELNNTEINDKTTPEKIRQNFELNVMDRVLDDVKRGTILGNFGLYHKALASAAVIYDTYPRTAQLLEFLMQRGAADTSKGCTGGNITRKLVDMVEREALTLESSVGYNKLMPSSLLEVAKILSIYEENTNPDTNLYKNPKFIKALKVIIPYITVTVAANISDNSGTGAFGFSTLPDLELAGWEATKQPIFAQLLYFSAKGNLENIRGDIFTKNPEGIQDEIEEVIEKYGEYDYTKSGITTGYGIAHLKGGTKFTTPDSNVISNSLRDFWIYFGSAPIGHNHNDTLHLGIEAFGLDMSPDFGYPAEMVGAGATKRHNWDSATASHNTVMVNDMQQINHREGGIPHHFDDAGDIQVVDVDAPQAYPNITDVYRRTVVSVDIDDTVSYALDFFRIVGGDEHLYSFHAQSQSTKVTGVELIPQTIGTYAGPDVPYAEDTYYDKEDGFNFIYNVERAKMPGTGTFTADFDVDMLRNAKPLPEKDWHLRLTQLNDFDITEVALADGKPPIIKQNPDHFDYIFVRRSGKDLDTLFTSVIEPCIGETNIESMERLGVSRRDGKPMREDEPVAAVKIKLKNG